MNGTQKLEILQESFLDSSEFDLLLNKLFDVLISQYRARLKRYERDLNDFEAKYGLDSAQFYRQFENGELGDATDFFEWASLYELYKTVQEKIQRLESAV